MEISSAKVRHWEFQSRRKQQVRAIGPQITENKRIMKKVFMLSIAAMALATLSAHAGDAKSIYADNCTKCHGADGKGDTKMGQRLGVKDYSTAAVQDALKDDVAFKSIKEGLKDKDGKTLMKAADGIADEDIKALVAYMRTFKK